MLASYARRCAAPAACASCGRGLGVRHIVTTHAQRSSLLAERSNTVTDRFADALAEELVEIEAARTSAGIAGPGRAMHQANDAAREWPADSATAYARGQALGLTGLAF